MKTLFLFLFTSIFAGGVKTSASALYLTARETRTNSWAQKFEGSCDRLDIDLLNVPFGFDPGFKVGIGYESSWDVFFRYTWFRTVAKKSSSTKNGEIASSFIGNYYIDTTDGSGPAYRGAHISWSILLNVIDSEMGYTYFLGEKLKARPFVGIKGGWIRQSIDSTWKDPIDKPFSKGRESLSNHFWGLGPSFGVNSTWTLFQTKEHLLNLLFDFSSAPMFGHFSFKDKYQNDANQTVAVKVPSANGGATTFSSFAGVEWRGFPVRIKAGFETQIWLDNLRYYSLNAGRLNDELTFQGGLIEVLAVF